jgi:hypothetical protein
VRSTDTRDDGIKTLQWLSGIHDTRAVGGDTHAAAQVIYDSHCMSALFSSFN